MNNEWIDIKVTPEMLHITLVDFEFVYKKSKVNGRMYRRKKPIKSFLSINATLKVDTYLQINGVYLDNTNRTWLCTSTLSLYGGISFLKNTYTKYDKPKSFVIPSRLFLVSSAISERK